LGAKLANAALGAGDHVVATGRRQAAVTVVVKPDADRLRPVELDVTDAAQARTAVDAAISRFGGNDVLVNNAAFGQMGFFEELTIKAAHEQFAKNLFSAFCVTWAVLPRMRSARKDWIFNILSRGGIFGAQLGSLYCSSKFALEGFSECLSKEVSPFGIWSRWSSLVRSVPSS
jgi:NAD(P)-dependent dehydrogenase (short-subunit alcohol dehydrogenase family)